MKDCPRCGWECEDVLGKWEYATCGWRSAAPIVYAPSPTLCKQQRDWYTDIASLIGDVPLELFDSGARGRLTDLYQQAKAEAEEWDNLLQNRKQA
jgi:hypothetical protein